MKVSKTWCPQVLETNNSYVIPATQWHDFVEITVHLCKFFKLSKVAITHALQTHAQGNER